ncbi:hypothetical protein [Vibrio sp. 10N.247.311.51]|uniref:hypothetical protein n=1 Tax=Vibrio sp. 10N.247.311.51 TaxID=3229996 RepID=UPI003550DDDF
MGRRSNAKSWLTSSEEQETWVKEYLLKKKISWSSGLADAASRSSASAIKYLKDLDESISTNKLLLQQASSAWRAKKNRIVNKQINISISKNAYKIVDSLAKANGSSIKAMIDFLITESQTKIEELERLKKVELEYLQACKRIEELETELSKRRKVNDDLKPSVSTAHEKEKSSNLQEKIISAQDEPTLHENPKTTNQKVDTNHSKRKASKAWKNSSSKPSKPLWQR